MSWFKLAKKANAYAEAKAQSTFDEHADPKVQVEQAITALQTHQRELEEAASHVIAQEKQSKMRLSTATDRETRLIASAKAAANSGNQDAARSFALQLAPLREEIRGLTQQIPALESAANDARTAVQEGSDNLRRHISERSTILAQIDQTKMQTEMARSIAAVSDLTDSSDVPSLDAVKNKVQGQFAEAMAKTDLQSTSPEVLEMHAHHDELNAEADSILAEITGGTIQPALGTGGKA